jgi:hypothetical protein
MDDNSSNNLQDLAAQFNNHQITDETGELTDETTSVEDTAALEENTDDDSASAEKPAETEQSDSTSESTDSEKELAEDDSGKRYVPEARFKEVYAKLKAKERESQKGTQTDPLKDLTRPLQVPNLNTQDVDTTASLELELLKTTLPQFDNNSSDYSPELDQLGATIYKAEGRTDAKGNFKPGITKIEAARRAIAQAKRFTQDQIAIATEARQVKSSQADQGITNRVVSRNQTGTPDPDKMTLEEKEAWLKSNGQW